MSISRQSLYDSTSILKALPGKLDIKRHSASVLYIEKPMSQNKIDIIIFITHI